MRISDWSSDVCSSDLRKALAWTGAVAVASSLAVFGFSASAYGTVYETGRGEIRLVPLHDGSTMFLNTSSKVRVNYGQRERLVTLEEGEAYFSVAQDTKRPFVVAAGEHRLRTSDRQSVVSGRGVYVSVDL